MANPETLQEQDSSRFLPYLNGQGWRDTLTLNGQFFWDFLRDTYYGSGGYATGEYLIPFPNEHSVKFANRKKKREITNHFQVILDALFNPVFKNPVTRTEYDKFGDLLIQDADGQGTTLTGCIKKAGLHQEIFGVTFLLVDNGAESPESEADLMAGRKAPYLVEILPEDVIEYEINSKGTLIFFKYRSTMGQKGGENALGFGRDAKTLKKYAVVTWTPESVQIQGQDPKINELGYIPIVRVTTNTSPDFIPWPHNYSLATEQLRIFNLNSDIAEIEDNQGHSIFYGQFGSANAISNSPANFLNVPMDAKMPPSYASAPAENLRTMLENREQRVQDMYAMAGLPLPSSYAVSGEAKKMDMMRFAQRISRLKNTLEDAEMQIWEIYADYFGGKLKIPEVVYNREFGIHDIDSEIDALERLKEIGLPVEMQRDLTEKIIRMLKGKLSKAQDDFITQVFDTWQTQIKEDSAPI
jgi:hypothetical protein